MKYPEFERLVNMVDLRNRFAACYRDENGNVFYIEPGFYKALQAIRNIYPDRYDEAIETVLLFASQNPITIFAQDGDNPIVEIEQKAVILSPADIIDRMGLIIEDKSRGSDYGD